MGGAQKEGQEEVLAWEGGVQEGEGPHNPTAAAAAAGRLSMEVACCLSLLVVCILACINSRPLLDTFNPCIRNSPSAIFSVLLPPSCLSIRKSGRCLEM